VTGFFSSGTVDENKPACDGDDCVSNDDQDTDIPTTDNSEATPQGEPETRPPPTPEDATSQDSTQQESDSTKSEEPNANSSDDEAKTQDSKESGETTTERSERSAEEPASEGSSDSTSKSEDKTEETKLPPPPPAAKAKPVKRTLGVETQLTSLASIPKDNYEAARKRLDDLLVSFCDRCHYSRSAGTPSIELVSICIICCTHRPRKLTDWQIRLPKTLWKRSCTESKRSSRPATSSKSQLVRIR
jgi:hypothetical protein